MLPFPKCLPPIIFLCSYLQSAISIAITPSALSEDLALVVGGGEGREVEVVPLLQIFEFESLKYLDLSKTHMDLPIDHQSIGLVTHR